MPHTHSSETLLRRASAMQVPGYPERPDGHAGERAEGGAGGARSAQDRQQGVAAPKAARRDRARASCRESESHDIENVHRMDTFTVL